MGPDGLGVKEFKADRERDEQEKRVEKRRAAWITFAAAALAGCRGCQLHRRSGVANWAADDADDMLAELDELDKRDFSGGG